MPCECSMLVLSVILALCQAHSARAMCQGATSLGSENPFSHMPLLRQAAIAQGTHAQQFTRKFRVRAYSWPRTKLLRSRLLTPFASPQCPRLSRQNGALEALMPGALLSHGQPEPKPGAAVSTNRSICA